MLEVAIQREADWPEADWEDIAQTAVAEAIRQAPQSDSWLTRPLTIEVSIRLTNDAEVQTLNREYRQKDKPTNVLSFPMVQPDLLEGLTNSDDGEVLLGDIVLARETCAREAEEKGVAFADHATHLIVHGTLHLLGFDHMGDSEAEAMEALERSVLATLGIDDPYEIRED
jgi:probable rRNA maturation factor